MKAGNWTPRKGEDTMKIVSISDALQFRDDDGIMRCDVTDLNKIVAGIDRAKGRNDALVAYVYALRDLQRANDLYAILDNSPSAASAIDRAEERVRATLSELVMAQLALLAQLCAR
jgi:hypothetical protein